ncbi:hypothetical protein fugu_020138 [Takifugu bimaculatus]|nr:hypothetical protein fugu_020138 [Takifugu bimaculatus]
MSINAVLLLLMCASVSAVGILTWPPLNCSQQGLQCITSTTNCWDSDLRPHQYTPSGPEELQVTVDFRRDRRRQLQPVLHISWKLKDDGSIHFLNATELHVLEASTNQNLCVRYSFKDKLPMRSPAKEMWSFSADIVVNPDQSYTVSVYNIPKPELNHNNYNVDTLVSVSGCQEKTMKHTQVCIEQGSLWQPNISLAQLSGADGLPVLTVNFQPDALCEEYMVIVDCARTQHNEHVFKTNKSSLSATFSLDKWPRSCCQFRVQIKPLFPRCGEDCTRQATMWDICPVQPTAPPAVLLPAVVVLPVVFTLVVMAAVGYGLYRRAGSRAKVASKERGKQLWQKPLKHPPKVLVIYSQDHPLYREIVLKLCAFLQAKCGTEVLLDLLDSASVGMVGPLRWLELQLQKLEDPCDKILVLCSRGVQAKWRAVCGQGRVMLRQDVLSPTDEILTPFLNLLLPNMHQAGMMGKYLIAYFDEVSTDEDVPSVFDIAVKYKLMKHFEELYFRILDMEKYHPDQVNHIEGIGCDEYFNCPSGETLRNAIQTFRDFQFEHPDWFANECVEAEEDVIMEPDVPISQLQVSPVLECVPLIRDGLPFFIREVELKESQTRVHICSPELNPPPLQPSVAEQTPLIRDNIRDSAQQQPLNQPFTHHTVPGYHSPAAVSTHGICFSEGCFRRLPVEDQDSSLQHSGVKIFQSSSADNRQSEVLPPLEVRPSQPVSTEELLEPRKIQSHRSDLGYISKTSSQQEPGSNEGSLVALRRLQERLLLSSLQCSDLEET